MRLTSKFFWYGAEQNQSADWLVYFVITSLSPSPVLSGSNQPCVPTYLLTHAPPSSPSSWLWNPQIHLAVPLSFQLLHTDLVLGSMQVRCWAHLYVSRGLRAHTSITLKDVNFASCEDSTSWVNPHLESLGPAHERCPSFTLLFLWSTSVSASFCDLLRIGCRLQSQLSQLHAALRAFDS